MSLTSIYRDIPQHPVYMGSGNELVLERALQLAQIYDPRVHERYLTFNIDGEDITICTYFWSGGNEGGAPLCIILNGIITNGRSNDHFAYELSKNYGFDVLCFDYPGKGQSSRLPTKEHYTPRMYASVLKELLYEMETSHGDISLIGYSHGARVIFDLFDLGWDTKTIKSIVIGDMGPERPLEAAKRRALRNQHNPIYPDLKTALHKLRSFFSGHGKSLPDDFIIHMMDRNFSIVDDGQNRGIWNGYDPRAMFGYCDEVTQNPTLDCWRGFSKIGVPLMLLLGQETNTVMPQTLRDMIYLKGGRISLSDVHLSRGFLNDQFHLASSHAPQASDFFVLEFEGTGHYPEPHRESHARILSEFMRSPGDFSIVQVLSSLGDSRVPISYLESAQRLYGCIPMTKGQSDADLFGIFQQEPLFS